MAQLRVQGRCDPTLSRTGDAKVAGWRVVVPLCPLCLILSFGVADGTSGGPLSPEDSVNLPLERRRFQAVWGGVPPVTRCFIALLLVGSILAFFSSGFLGFLSLTPQYTFALRFRVWAVFTAAFVESSIVLLIVECVCLGVLGPFAEALWGRGETLFYLCLVSALSSVGTFFTAWVFQAAEWSPMMGHRFSGAVGVIGAVAIAAKQIAAEQELRPIPMLRVKHVPFSLLVFVVCFDIMGVFLPRDPNQGSSIVFFVWGAVVGWMYLRFWQTQPGGGDRQGDVTESFSFSSIFPPPLSHAIAAVSAVVYRFVTGAGLLSSWDERSRSCRRAHTSLTDPSGSLIELGLGSESGTLPGSTPEDAERRRLLALQALNDRMRAVQEREAAVSGDMDRAGAADSTTVVTDRRETLQGGDDSERAPVAEKHD